MENIDEIIEVADGIMVARGGWGGNSRSQVPHIQKMIIHKYQCKLYSSYHSNADVGFYDS